MSKTLFIAEKPSVATDLARVLGKELGKFTRDKSGAFYQNDRAIITSAVGHLLEQKKPMTEGGKSLPWKFDYLPVIPRTFELEPIKQSAKGSSFSTTWCVTENGPSLRAACGCSP